MRQIALPKLLLIDVVININRLAARVSTQLFDKIPGHSRPEQMSYKKVSAAMRGEPLLKPCARCMQTYTLSMFFDGVLDSSLSDSSSGL